MAYPTNRIQVAKFYRDYISVYFFIHKRKYIERCDWNLFHSICLCEFFGELCLNKFWKIEFHIRKYDHESFCWNRLIEGLLTDSISVQPSKKKEEDTHPSTSFGNECKTLYSKLRLERGCKVFNSGRLICFCLFGYLFAIFQNENLDTCSSPCSESQTNILNFLKISFFERVYNSILKFEISCF